MMVVRYRFTLTVGFMKTFEIAQVADTPFIACCSYLSKKSCYNVLCL